MLITHGHADHFLDIIPAFYARHYGGKGEPGLPFYSPRGLHRSRALLVSENGRNVMARPTTSPRPTRARLFEIGPFRVTPYEMTHIGVYSLGYPDRGRRRGARVQRRHRARARRPSSWRATPTCSCARPRIRTRPNLTYFHLSAAQAAQHAARADAGAPDADAHHARPRSGRVAGRGGRGVRHGRDRGARHGRSRSARDAVRRPRQRTTLRPVSFELGFQEWADGSVLFSMGKTRVLCAASVAEETPRWLRGTGKGWVTGEYSMLPASTSERSQREVNRGRPGGRTQEIQRLIGRALRSVTDLPRLGERMVTIDCDVLQADAGTRTASITGGYIALALALRKLSAAGATPDDLLTRLGGRRVGRDRRRRVAAWICATRRTRRPRSTSTS